ncbi:hypothetical protein [Desulfobacter vibrioformis]|uniref:hypothetical protein n=1 Tax=Desulfobacter vibrioformis TaxID=34031 RepID=UPI0005561611|nr:hypothetical protein [Desulfobacter vibrioformis]
MPYEENLDRSKIESSESFEIPQELNSFLSSKGKENLSQKKKAEVLDEQAIGHDSKANDISNARQILEDMNGQETTPENEEKVRAARAALGKAADDLPKDVKKAVEEKQEKDSILNDQVADGRLNLNQIEDRIVEFETHQRAELHHAIENQLSTKLIPALAGFGIDSLSDLQLAMNCDSPADLIATCEKILEAASPQTERDFKTSDIRESIGNLNALEDILVAAFRLHREDPDFRLEKFRIDPEAAVRMVLVEGEMEKQNII